MNIYKELLFLHGYVTNPRDLADDPAENHGVRTSPAAAVPLAVAASVASAAAAKPADAAPVPARPAATLVLRAPVERLFDGALPLIATTRPVSRLGLEEEEAYGPRFGNRLASRRIFGGASSAHGGGTFAADCALGACA
ncbi:hypothetical protein [Lysobacter sp. D1-1-M9]|uniref:hypothetical protein n=1 Tax=Novilysobacter longmucuonensis TaxID=3098603 RepID=UPI002FC8132A